VFKFLALFGFLMALFYAFTQTAAFKDGLLPFVIKVNAHTSNLILVILGQGTAVEGTRIASPAFSVDIKRGCDALEPIAFFLFGVLSYPAPLRRKWPGMLAGVVVLFLLNLIRIVSLYLIGKFFYRLFEFMHADFWQVVFIIAAIVLWAVWIMWATRPASGDAVDGGASEPAV